MTEPTSTPPTVPCRRALLDLVFSIQLPARRACVWEIPRPIWSAIKRDPELRSNWTEQGVRTRDLFNIPVRLIERGRFRLTIEIR